MSVTPPVVMKDSGIEWLGRVPTHWEVKKLKHWAWLLNHRRIPLNSEDRASLRKVYPYYGASGIIDYVEDYLFDEPLILIAEDGANLLSRSTELAFIASGRYWVNNHAHILKPKVGPLTYWVGRLNSIAYTPFVTGAAQPKLTIENLSNIDFAAPPLDEQIAIANFLDRKTSQIDGVVAKKQRMIDLLHEKQKAIINEIITKGLDPDVPTKGSGIEWLGRVPQHWSVERLKWRMRKVEQGWSPQCNSRPADPGEWGVLKVGCMNSGRYDESENKALPAELPPLPEMEVKVGDVLMSRSNTVELVGCVGRVHYTQGKILVCDKLYRLVFADSQLDPEYAVLVLRSHSARLQIERDASGASASMKNISNEVVADLVLAFPPLDEQRAIVAHVHQRLDEIRRMESLIESQIVKLREYRQALITAAVTGQIDVTTEGQR